MKMSPFFSDLSASYAYEIEDLTWDSGGGDVLAARLKVKRDQFAHLLPMSGSDPVMVAPAFHGGFRFGAREIFDALIAGQPGEFPSWASVAAEIELEPWAGKLAQRALATPDGEAFMLIAAGLEYVLCGRAAPAPAAEVEAAPGKNPVDADEDEDTGEDLAEAGEDYLSEQGFERRS